MTRFSNVGEVLQWVVGGIALSLLVRTWLVLGLVEPVTVAGRSMEPVLKNGERILVDRSALLFSRPARWDVVVFRCPNQADRFCVKRIAGLPGESIELVDGKVVVNGRALFPPGKLRYKVRYQDWAVFRQRNRVPPATQVRWQLGPQEYFMLGDNSGDSEDSRCWMSGPGLNAKLLVGKALGVH